MINVVDYVKQRAVFALGNVTRDAASVIGYKYSNEYIKRKFCNIQISFPGTKAVHLFPVILPRV